MPLSPHGGAISTRGKPTRSAAAVFASAVMLSACFVHRHPEQMAPAQSPERDSLLLADAHRSDSPPSASSFSPDAVYLRAGASIVFGRANVMSLLAAPGARQVSTTWQPLGGGISLDAMSGYTFGIAATSDATLGSPRIARYIAFWNRQSGAPWTIAAYAEVGASAPTMVGAASASIDGPGPAMSPAARRAAAAIASADSDFADAAAVNGTALAFSNAAADDAVIFGGPEIIIGPRGIKDFFEAQPGTSLSWHPVYAYAAASADLGFSVGESIATSRGQSGAAVQRFGKYLTVWRRQPDRAWKFVVDGGNARPSPVEKLP
jgi:ketosteroid isomerase-like protein